VKHVNPMMTIIGEYLPLLAMLFIIGHCWQRSVQAQDSQMLIPNSPEVIADTISPMYQAAELLSQIYSIPVTYEDPILNWSGDMDQVPIGIGKMHNIPKRMTFTMPIEALPSKTPTLDVGLLQRVADAYQEQTDGPRFKVASSRWGLHLIPDQVRDRGGRFVKAITFLDTVISIPEERRIPSGHVAAICNAINASTATGIHLDFFPNT